MKGREGSTAESILGEETHCEGGSCISGESDPSPSLSLSIFFFNFKLGLVFYLVISQSLFCLEGLCNFSQLII